MAAETVGSAGVSTLSIAQILGVSERNNRRDEITSVLMLLDGWCLQGMEGQRADLDRLLARLWNDRRLTGLRTLIDKPITSRSFAEPMSFCIDPRGALKTVGVAGLAEITGAMAEHMVDLKLAA